MEFQYQTQKLIKWIDIKVEGYSRSEKHQFNIIKIYTIFKQYQGKKVPIDYKPEDTETYVWT